MVAFNAGHDGAVAYIRDEELVLSFEAEKDSFPRYSAVTPSVTLNALAEVEDLPDVVAIGGWTKHRTWSPIEAGYFGISQQDLHSRSSKLFGRELRFFSSTHEKAHLFTAYGMSPFPQGEPCYVLLWEGSLGSFYEVREDMSIAHVGQALNAPGNRYGALYALADPKAPASENTWVEPECAGKLMALAAYGSGSPPDHEEQKLIRHFLEDHSFDDGHKFSKIALNESRWFNIGVESDEFKEVARKYSDALFDRFLKYAENRLRPGLPLVIGGGCGLNCEWNSRWLQSGLFADVFVPPCANDSGSAIGTAIEAMFHHTGNAKIGWRVDSGPRFHHDVVDLSDFESGPLVPDQLASFLNQGKIVGWVQGRCEIGPRALGHRSILAAPFLATTLERLNKIKQRESFRPIAPVCLEEDVSLHFDWHRASPHMLYFQKVKSANLKAITHVDGSARVQTVNRGQNPRLSDLLQSFKAITGSGVLCNTSLNFKGTGFINSMSDLVRYCKGRDLDGFVVDDMMYMRSGAHAHAKTNLGALAG